ncbi:fimbria/pilus periplasmic chaperone [Serratia fonticola]
MGEQHVNTTTKAFSVKLGATRVIYNPDSAGNTLPVINQQDYPILVQSRVYAEDQKTVAPFVVTPPVFRLDALQQNRVRVVRTGGAFAPDRETLYWLCVTGIPPKAEDIWGQDGKKPVPDTATLEVQVRINNCVKLLVRPSSLKGDPAERASSMTWTREGGKLKVVNPTPFFMNLKEISVGGKRVVDINYVPPMGARTFTLPAGASGPVQWKVITDYGGESREFQAALP